MRALRHSLSRTVPPVSVMLLADAPQLYVAPGQSSGPNQPGLVDRCRVAPPHSACQPSAARRAFQSSHMRLVEGCLMTSTESEQRVGMA
jgi:hypothetical protein